MKRSAESAPLYELIADEKVRSFLLEHFSEQEIKDRLRPSFPLELLPVELIIKIIDEHLETFLAIFELNKNLERIQAQPGFWLTLFKARFPEKAARLAFFLSESPEIGRLSSSLLYTIDKLAGLRNWSGWGVSGGAPGNLLETESEILNGLLEAVEKHYTTGYTYDHWSSVISLTLHKYLIRLQVLIDDSQYSKNQLLRELSSWLDYETIDSPQNLTPALLLDFIDLKLKQLRESKTPIRVARFITMLEVLKAQLMDELNAITDFQNREGREPTVLNWYFPTLGKDFEAYFALTPEEASKLWKKFYIQARRDERHPLMIDYHKGPTLSDFDVDCIYCASKATPHLDNKLNVVFCGSICQETFYNHFYSPHDQGVVQLDSWDPTTLNNTSCY